MTDRRALPPPGPPARRAILRGGPGDGGLIPDPGTEATLVPHLGVGERYVRTKESDDHGLPVYAHERRTPAP